MIKKIMIAHDGSENADKALDVALDLADRYNVELILLSVNSSIGKFAPWISFPSVSQDTLDAYLKEIDENQQEMLLAALNKAKKAKPGIKISKKVVNGKPADMIVETARKEEVNLIVIGSRGLSGADEFFLGSVSDRVADKASCPVLIIK
jgi:nucleotide-binding universal stress UspA family protein